MDNRSHWRPSRAVIAAGLVLIAISTVALSDELFVTDAKQVATVLDAGGQYLTSSEYKSLVTVGEALVHPQKLRGDNLVMEPGYLPKVRLMAAAVVSPDGAPVLANRLRGNFPNPFNPSTNIRFSLAQPGPASLKIYDVRGRMIRTLIDGPMTAGDHDLRWDGRTEDGSRAASGVYFMRLVTSGFSDHRKLVLSR